MEMRSVSTISMPMEDLAAWIICSALAESMVSSSSLSALWG